MEDDGEDGEEAVEGEGEGGEEAETEGVYHMPLFNGSSLTNRTPRTRCTCR